MKLENTPVEEEKMSFLPLERGEIYTSHIIHPIEEKDLSDGTGATDTFNR